jgi:hypothetical protein
MSWVRFHPLTRITIVVAVIIGAALSTGMERVGDALANISPGGSFEDRCRQLPESGVQVGLQPFSVKENLTLPFSALTQINDGSSLTHRTIGLTRANFGHRSSIDVKGLEDRTGHRACVRPRVQVDLFLRPMTVFVASEYAADPCRARTIREHEQRHVDVYVGYARESVDRLASRLSEIVGDAPHFASTVNEAQHRIDRRIEDALESFMRESERTLAARQAEVDTPEEYARVTGACVATAGKE